MSKCIFGLFCAGLILSLAAFVTAEEPQVVAPDESTPADSIQTQPEASQTIVATYFHGNRRCATCMKLEALSTEAVTEGFAPEIESGLIEWRVVNFDEEENKHFSEDYKLFSQSVILSRMQNGKETEWKNLDKIWTLVGDKEKFLSYVREEMKSFIAGPSVEKPE